MKKQKFTVMDSMIYFIYTLFALVCLYPFYYIFINTISDNSLVARGEVMWYPVGLHLSNYVQVLQIKGLFHATFISVARTVIGTVIALISASFMGYAFTKQEYWGRKFWYRFTIATMYFSAGIIPWYLTMKTLGLTNNFLGYVLPSMVGPFNLVLAKTYIESIPSSLEESAEIDGAGYFTRYMRIVLPLAKPILATVAIFAAVGQWNSFMDTVYLMTKEEFYTLQFLLYQYLNEANAITQIMKQTASGSASMNNMINQLTPASVRFTITMVTVLPVLLVYPFFQKYFVKGIMIGAVKG